MKLLYVDGTAVYTTGYNAGQNDSIPDTIAAIYSGVNTSSNQTLTCTQGSATNSKTRSVQNSSGSFHDVLYNAYIDIPLYKYDDTGCLYILKSVQHYMKGSVSANWETMSSAAGFRHCIYLLDENGTQLGVVNRGVNNGTTGTTFNYTDTVSLSAFDYAINTSTVRIKVITTLSFAMISGNSGTFTQTGTAWNNGYITVTYLKQP